jgi:phage terminase large subunit-like protein
VAEGKTDECGIVVAGRDLNQEDYVLADRSLKAEPTRWAYEAVKAFHDFKADMIVAEANNGGEMVRMTIHQADPNVPVDIVYATRGKYTRAEPHALRYDQGLVHHVGSAFESLEEEMATWQPSGGMASPNRIDALVWALEGLGASFSQGSASFF